MGNQNSRASKSTDDKETEDMKFENVISYIAAKYITTASFQDLQNLHKPEYCNKLVILTSKVIQKYLNDMDISYLAQRTEKGIEINKMDKANIIYLNKDDLEKIDVQQAVKKKRMCIGIGKFYIKIAHLFAAIAMTINPRYTYIDENGEKQTLPFQQRSNIPKGTKINTAYANLCSSRIAAIKPRQNTENGIILKVKNCNMNNINEDNVKNLSDETGIPELQALYFDDYNFTEGKYVGVTDEGMEVYMKDLEKFYTTFTGGECFPNKCGIIVDNMPDEDEQTIANFFTQKIGKVIFVEKKEGRVFIKFKKDKNKAKALKKKIKIGDIQLIITSWEITSFSDIPLKDFHNQALCNDKSLGWLDPYRGSPNDKLFKEYALHVKNMVENSQKLEKGLLSIIKQLFSFWVDPRKKEKVLTINPELNDKLLDELVEKAREQILTLYIGCEEDFQKGLKLFQTIIASKTIETAERRNKILKQKANEIENAQPQPEVPPEAPAAPETAPEAVPEAVPEVQQETIPQEQPQQESNQQQKIDEIDKKYEMEINKLKNNYELEIQNVVNKQEAAAGGRRKRRSRKKR